MMLHRPSSMGQLPMRTQSPRAMKPDFREGTVIEERSKTGTVANRYRWGRLLGKGGFAKCYEGTDLESGVVYAIKVICRAGLIKAKMQSKLHSEIAIHRRLSHHNIVKFYRTFQDEWYVYIILEKCSSQTLMEISRTRSRFSKEEAQFIMMQSISAIQYMHTNDVLHRDLKLGNMMMDVEMNVKIGDFGLAAELQFDGERKRTICGTPNYIAPEILQGATEGHSFEVDVWSLGVILYTLLVGEPPFQTNDVKATYTRIKQCRFSFPPGLAMSQSGKDLICQMLQSKPERRPSMVQVRQHPFFNGCPTSAPMTLFSESQKRRLEAHRASLKGAPAAREPLRTMYNGAASNPSSKPNTPREGLTRADSARDMLKPQSARQYLGSTDKPAAPAPTTNGWTSKPSSRPPSPRDPAPAPMSAAGTRPTTAVQRQTDEDEEKHHLTAVHDRLHRTFHGGATADDRDGDNVAEPTVWVTDYADFSSKYGLAYRMNTGHTAVHYNDSTKMVWEPVTNRAEYYARIKETVNGMTHAADQRQPFIMDNFPEALNKKVTLIKYFRSYLTKAKGKKDGVEVVTCSPFASAKAPLVTEPHMTSDMVYVKRWLLTSRAMIFRLSNKTIQVCFLDGAEVILSSETKVVTYTDAKGKRLTIPLSRAPSQSQEIADRLKYTKDILSELINNKEL